MLNCTFDDAAVARIKALQAAIQKRFPGEVWLQPPETLHITVMDWLAPLVTYNTDKAELFEQLFNDYDRAFTACVRGIAPITVRFDSVLASPSAIIVKGTDDGSMQHIRDSFMQKISLLPNTKMPPTIIHSSIARFTKEFPIEPLYDFIAQQEITFTYSISEIRLVKELVAPMLQYDLVKSYPLRAR
jgi:hypothetical protein